MLESADRAGALSVMSDFRAGFYGCLTARADALFELTDAMLCADGPVKTPAHDIDHRWQALLRRFDLKHALRLFKQTLGWTRPKIRTPEAGDRWTWLMITAHTQLRLARPLAEDLHAAMGEARLTRTTHPGASPARVQEHPCEVAPPGQCAETWKTWPRPTARLHQPAEGPALRRGQDRTA